MMLAEAMRDMTESMQKGMLGWTTLWNHVIEQLSGELFTNLKCYSFAP